MCEIDVMKSSIYKKYNFKCFTDPRSYKSYMYVVAMNVKIE